MEFMGIHKTNYKITMVIIQEVNMFIDGLHQIQLCMSIPKHNIIVLSVLFKLLSTIYYVNTNFLIVKYFCVNILILINVYTL